MLEKNRLNFRVNWDIYQFLVLVKQLRDIHHYAYETQ